MSAVACIAGNASPANEPALTNNSVVLRFAGFSPTYELESMMVLHAAIRRMTSWMR
jgi:hypothetical protein